MQSSLDVLKRQALFTIIGNMSISQVYLKEQINQYITLGDSSFTSLLSKMPFNQALISSSQVNSIYLLAYLDFYALYTILYANYPIFENLKNVSEQKYLYVDSLYKDLSVIINEKQFQMESLNTLYANFLYPKNLNLSESNSRENNNPEKLNTSILTLPIKSTKKILPRSIIIADDDKSIHSVTNNSTLDFVDYSIARSQNSMIGIVDKIAAGKETTAYQRLPLIKGTVYGFFSNRIFVQCSAITKIDGAIEIIYLKSSSNGQSWSSEYPVIPSIASNILIEGDINIGLTITLYDIDPVANQTLGLTVGDLWNIDIASTTIPDPKVKATVKFEALDFASYISFSDISTYALSDLSFGFKKKKYDASENIQVGKCYNGIFTNIIPMFSQASELSITAIQKDYYIKQIGTSLVYSFDFNLKDIHIVANEYKQQGSITFDSKKMSNVSMVSIDTDQYIFNEGIFDGTTAKQKSFIEYSIVLKNGSDEITLPVQPTNSSSRPFEYIIPSKVDSNTAYFHTRFPADISLNAFTVYNLYNGLPVDAIWNPVTSLFVITNYEARYSYAIAYNISYSTFADLDTPTLWAHNNKLAQPIYYTYFKDTNGKNSIMVRQDTGEKLFTGEIKSFVEMRSSDLPYVTPLVYEYALLGS